MTKTSQWAKIKRSGDRVGFTLTEMLLVVSVSLLLVMLLVPNVRGQMARYRLNAATTEVYSSLRSARQLAVSNGRSVQVRLDPIHSTFETRFDKNHSGTIESNEIASVWVGDYPGVAITSGPAGDGTFDARGTFKCATGYWKLTCTAPGVRTGFIYVFASGMVKRSDESI